MSSTLPEEVPADAPPSPSVNEVPPLAADAVVTPSVSADLPEPSGPSAALTIDTPADPTAAALAETAAADAPSDAVNDAGEAAASPSAPAPKRADDLSPAACAARLAELFPALFAAAIDHSGKTPAKPIKLRIHADIQARAPGVFSKRTLGIFFSRYTTTTPYLKALAQAPHRFDLDGQPAGDIADEHRQAAVEEVERRRSIAIEKRQALRRPGAPGSQGGPRRDGRAPDAAGVGEGVGSGEVPADATVAVAPRDGAPRREPRNAVPPREGRPPPRHAGPGRDQDRRGGPSAGRPRQGPQDRSPQGPPNRAPHPPRPDGRDRHEPRRFDDEPRAVLPSDPAQRERALLLRAFESSTLSKSNFCALKRLREVDLDSQLALARQERDAARATAGAPERR